MKASDLIFVLQHMIDKYGDLPVAFCTNIDVLDDCVVEFDSFDPGDGGFIVIEPQ